MPGARAAGGYQGLLRRPPGRGDLRTRRASRAHEGLSARPPHRAIGCSTASERAFPPGSRCHGGTLCCWIVNCKSMLDATSSGWHAGYFDLASSRRMRCCSAKDGMRFLPWGVVVMPAGLPPCPGAPRLRQTPESQAGSAARKSDQTRFPASRRTGAVWLHAPRAPFRPVARRF